MLTEKEEQITKLMTAKVIVGVKLNKINLEMGTAIRAEFSVIDQKIRKAAEHLYLPLQAELKSLDDQIKAASE